LNALVRIALSRPYTFIVMAMLIVIFGVLAALGTPTDIFPEIRVPVIGVAWNYTGLSPSEMSGRIVTPYERCAQHHGQRHRPHREPVAARHRGGEDLFPARRRYPHGHRPGDLDLADGGAQMPAGTTPPLIINYSAATVPILQLAQPASRSPNRSCSTCRQTIIRPGLISVPGAAIPYPYGGKVRQIQIDLDPAALQSKGLSAQDVSNAIAAQNQILPAGTVKIGTFQYNVRLNDSAETIEELNNLPIKTVDGATIYIRDVGQVRDGSSPQTNVVHVDGSRAVLSTILKNGSASTLAIVDGVKDRLPDLKETLPDDFKITPLNDQSVFVKGAINGVIKEGVIAAALTSVMILLFLGSWRSTVIIAISIPLAVLSAIAALSALRPDAEHHDPGRPGPGRRHPGRRRHGDHREHQLASGARQGRARTAILDGAAADRRAGLRLPALHLHRLRADVHAQGRGRLPVRADGRGRGLRDDRLVHPVADPGSDPGDVSAQAARPERLGYEHAAEHGHAGQAVAQSAGPLPARFRDPVRTLARRLPQPAGHGAEQSPGCSSSASWWWCWPRSA
jgi:hypothetical protein